MLRIARNEQYDCSGFARLRRSRKHVWHRGIIFFRPQLRNSIWDRSVKLSGFYRSGSRHISATDLTQYLLADLIVRVENTGFSYASPGPLGSRLYRLAFPAWNSTLRGRK